MIKISRILTKNKASIELILTDKIPYKYQILSFIGADAINTILEKTKSSIDYSGRPFKKYDKDYIESENFEIYEKSRKVNMELTGSMMASLKILSIGINSVTVGYDDPLEILKVYNHNTGDTVARREFFNLSGKDVDQLYKNALPDIELARERQEDATNQAKQLSTLIFTSLNVQDDPIKDAIKDLFGGFLEE